MSGGRAERIERFIDRTAAAAFAGSAGFALFKLASGAFGEPQLSMLSVLGALVSYFLVTRVLRGIKPEDRRFSVHEFALAPVQTEHDELELTQVDEFRLADSGHAEELVLTDTDRLELPELLLTELYRLELAELLLTDSDRLEPGVTEAPDELVLDDILAELGPDSRVVRLFDPAAMPTPGELSDRIEGHLSNGVSPAASPDAAQALHDALAELRRSLR